MIKSILSLKYSRKSLLVLFLMLLFLGALTSFSRESGGLDDACIRCHPGTFKKGLEKENKHLPFFERQCTVCHLAAVSPASPDSSTTVPEALITGTVVGQEPLWTKRSVLSSTEKRIAREHKVIIAGLDPDRPYRFRILARNHFSPAEPEQASSPWLGLLPGEILPSDQHTPSRIMAITAADSEMIKDVSLQAADRTTLSINWRTPIALHGEVQLEDLAGQGAAGGEAPRQAMETAAGGEQEPHPSLRSPEDLGVDVCYTCHPLSLLGTSHPVNLPGGGETRIPDELPTVNGMITCVTCHDPHGSQGGKLVRSLIVTKLCVACHQSFRNSSRATLFD